MFVNYDEWGGFFDHVSPVLVPDDRSSSNLEENFGITGFRMPGVAISPYARRGYVSHMTVTHESILKLISYRFGLGYLNKRHRYASNIGRSFDWENPNFDVPNLPLPLPPVTTPCDLGQGDRPRARGCSEAEKGEGLHIGSPEMLTYFDHFGYPTAPRSPTEIFSSPDSTVQRLTKQIGALGVTRMTRRLLLFVALGVGLGVLWVSSGSTASTFGGGARIGPPRQPRLHRGARERERSRAHSGRTVRSPISRRR